MASGLMGTGERLPLHDPPGLSNMEEATSSNSAVQEAAGPVRAGEAGTYMIMIYDSDI